MKANNDGVSMARKAITKSAAYSDRDDIARCLVKKILFDWVSLPSWTPIGGLEETVGHVVIVDIRGSPIDRGHQGRIFGVCRRWLHRCRGTYGLNVRRWLPFPSLRIGTIGKLAVHR
jgi:hypothetical protein